MTACAKCGAIYPNEESCANRFDVLLALDHSRQQPWGSRHGIAFAVYTLQHSDGIAEVTLQNCWLMLNRVYEAGDDRGDVVKGLRAKYRGKQDNSYNKTNASLSATWSGASLPERNPPTHFETTIVDLGEFSSDTYPDLLDAWCLATLRAWNATE